VFAAIPALGYCIAADDAGLSKQMDDLLQELLPVLKRGLECSRGGAPVAPVLLQLRRLSVADLILTELGQHARAPEQRASGDTMSEKETK